MLRSLFDYHTRASDSPHPDWYTLTQQAQWSPLMVTKYSWLFCPIPKNACSQWRMLSARLHEFPRWRDARVAVHLMNDRTIHESFARKIASQQNAILIDSISPNRTWTWSVVVRDPLARLLSAWLDKWQDFRLPVPFSAFVHAIARGEIGYNEHWRLQSDFCGLRVVPYHHIIRFENMTAGAYELFRDLNIQNDSVLHTGWGEGRSFLKDNNQLLDPGKRKDAGAQLCKYYTPELEEIVRGIYGEDCVRFGYECRTGCEYDA
jgi:hypothetical protein